ncbi:uncharacterized protein LOC135483697 [Lineus longissimus]|uniref:uncharacterized protein LOC135483697 n=1 Tax=Lineus longissimus TaxID=88925 RepID=UPI00315C89D2
MMAIGAVGYPPLLGFGLACLGHRIRLHHDDKEHQRFYVRSRLLCAVTYLNLGLAGPLKTFMSICYIQYGIFRCEFKRYRGPKSLSKITRRDRRCNVYRPNGLQELPKSCEDIRKRNKKAVLGNYVVYPQGNPHKPRRRHCNPYTFRGFKLPKSCKDISRSKRKWKTGNNVIYPLGSWGKLLNVYCSKLRTFVTLKKKNWSEFEKRHHNGGTWDFGTKVTFKKIQIRVSNDGKIKVIRNGKKPNFFKIERFSSHERMLPAYGMAASSHPIWNGDFKIDLRGTGLKVSSKTKWKGQCKSSRGKVRSAKHMNLRRKADDWITGKIRGRECYLFPRPSKNNKKWKHKGNVYLILS